VTGKTVSHYRIVEKLGRVGRRTGHAHLSILSRVL